MDPLVTERSKLDAIVESLRAGVWEWNVQTGELRVNDRWAEIVGHTLAELAPVTIATWQSLAHPDDRAHSNDLLRRHFDGELPCYDCSVRMRHKQGHWIWVRDRGKVATRTPDGRPEWMVGSHVDVSSQQQTIESLERMKLLLSEGQKIAHLGTFEYVADTQTTIWSEEEYRIYGLDPGAPSPPYAEMLERSIHPDDVDLLHRTFTHAMQTLTVYELEHRIVRPDGSIRWVYDCAHPYLDDHGHLVRYIGTTLDITGRKRLEAQLQQAQKLEAVGQLAGGVAHDFNNILAATMMHIELLQANPKIDQETKHSLRELGAEAQRAASLTRQLLMFSRRSVLAMKTLDVNSVVSHLLKMLRRLIGEHIDLRFDPHADLPSVEADAGMLEQVVMNLVVNARDAMPGGGRITIATGVEVLGADDVQVHPGRRAGTFARLSVTDTGTGMDAATVARLFEPFFTTKEAGKGTGLGLATVHGIVAQHNGWVEVTSEPGRGATFDVFIPAIEAVVPAETQEAQADVPVPGGSETILVVEDEANLRALIALTLEGLGYRTLQASSGREALRVWRRHGRDVDLLLTDVVMPEGMTGIQLSERLTARKPSLRTIISSGYSAELAQFGASAKDGTTYLAKPYDRPELARAVREALDRP